MQIDLKAAENRARQELSALSQRHTTLSYLQIVVIVLVLLVGGWAVMHSMRGYERALAISEIAVQNYREDAKQLRADLKESEERRVEIASQQRVIETRIETRTQEAGKRIEEVMAPGRTAEQVAADSTSYLGVIPEMTPLGKLAYKASDVQGFVKTKIERDLFEANLNDTKADLALERQATNSYAEDLGKCKGTLEKANDAINKQEKVVKKTKMQKVFGVLKDGGKLAVGAIIGGAVAAVLK